MKQIKVIVRKNVECLLGNSIVWLLDPDKNKLGHFITENLVLIE